MPQILPSSPTGFRDLNGEPLANGQVFYYEPGGTVAKLTWTTEDLTTPNSNPVLLDGDGFPTSGGIWGVGRYRQIILDENDVQISDNQVTCWPDFQELRLGSTATGKNAIALAVAPGLQPEGAKAYSSFMAPEFAVAQTTDNASVSATYKALGVKPVYLDTTAGPTAIIPAALLRAGNLARLIYDEALAGGAGGWHLDGPALSAYIYGVAAGAVTSIAALAARVTALEAKETIFASLGPTGDHGAAAWMIFTSSDGVQIEFYWASEANITTGATRTAPFRGPPFATNGQIITASVGTNVADPLIVVNNVTSVGFDIINKSANTVNVSFMAIGVI